MLREGGFTREAALAMMGNIGAESAFKSNIVERRCPMGDFDYTHNVNIGSISREDFCHDTYGYGLCQWTLPVRKGALYDYAIVNLASIGDELMQAKFILYELENSQEYASLLQYLKTTTDMYEATAKICTQYERPTVNNIETRYSIAVQCSQQVFDGEPDFPEPPEPEPPQSCDITVRVLRKGYKGRDVFLLQCALRDFGCNLGQYGADGDFGTCTQNAVMEFQRVHNLADDGIVKQDDWQIIFQV